MASRTSITKEVTEDILMILLGIAVFVLPEGIPQTICLGGLIVVALYSCLEGVLRIIASADRMKSLKEEIRQLKTDLDQARKSADQVPESDHKLLELPELIPGKLRENAGIIQTVITSVYPDVPLVYKDYFRQVADLSRVDSLLVLLNEHSVKPFVDRLRQMEQPMSDEDYKQVLRELLQFSFLMLDFVDTAVKACKKPTLRKEMRVLLDGMDLADKMK